MYIRYSQYVILVVFLVIVVLIFFNDRFYRNLQGFDFYDEHHNHELHLPMILKKTAVGGFFTIVFAIVAMYFIFFAVIKFSVDNVTETKSLLPLVTIE